VFQSVAAIDSQFGIPSEPAEWMDRTTNGVALFAFTLATLGLAFRFHLRGDPGTALIVSLVSLAALAALGEAFLMHSLWVSAYYGEFLFFLFFGFFFWNQTAADFVSGRRFAPKSLGARPSSTTERVLDCTDSPRSSPSS
jgi:hypothetical protein